MKNEKIIKVSEDSDDGLDGDTIRDFSAHLKKEPEVFEEDSVRKLPGYFLIGGVLAITFLAIFLLHLARQGSIIRNFRELIPIFSFSYALVGVLVLIASIFSQKKKLMYEIGRILLSASALMLILVVAYEFFINIVRP
ncbi:MAG: hypothetical protein V1909_05975 [Candidatus Micrarchaeota archaeon]